MSKDIIVAKIQKLQEFVDTVDSSNNNTSAIWDFIKEIQLDFKAANLERQEQQELWEEFQKRITELKYKQEDIRNENEAIIQKLLLKLEEIDYQIADTLVKDDVGKEDFAAAKKVLSEVREFIKTPFYPSRESRQEVWNVYQGMNERVKEREDKYYEVLKKARDEKYKNADQLTENIIDLLNACHSNLTPESLEKLNIAMANLSELGCDTDAIKSILEINKNQESLKIKSESLRTVRNFIRTKHDELRREHKDKIYDRLAEVQSDLDNAWEAYKKSRSSKHENWKKKQIEFVARLELRIVDQKQYKQKQEARLEDQKNYLKKLYSRLNNQKDFIQKLKEGIFKQQQFISRQEKHIESLEDKYHAAMSDSFRTRVNEWMDEAEEKIESAEDSIVAKKDKIKEVEESIVEIEDKIKNVKNSIDKDIPNKIKDVDKSIVEIQATIKDVLSKLE